MDILVIEDEQKIAQALKEKLAAENYSVTLATNGDEGFFQATTAKFDIIVLDWFLPGRDGIQILTAVRQRGLATPILLLTARDDLQDRIDGLDSGADDYVIKPFAFVELLARIRALLRRGCRQESLCLTVGDLDMNLVSRKVVRCGEIVDLTLREYELLEFLMRHENEVVSRNTLALAVWKEPDRGTPIDNVIDVHIARLRRKVDLPSTTKLIHTVRGIGFVLRHGEP